MAGPEKKENDFFNFWSKEKVVRQFLGVKMKLTRSLFNLIREKTSHENLSEIMYENEQFQLDEKKSKKQFE